MMNAENRKAFVCGWPIEHSKSPLIHNYWLSQFAIAGSYEKIAIAPADFKAFLSGLRDDGFAGGNVTIPHKQAAMEQVDRLEAAAGKIGAVNTLWFEDDKLVGGNTDWIGFAANLDQHAPSWEEKTGTAIVVGAGGAARAILYALIQRGVKQIFLANRTFEKAQQLAEEFGSDAANTTVIPLSLDDIASKFSDADLLVNTSSMGMQSAPEFPAHLLAEIPTLKSDALVTDIVYVPLETPLLLTARKSGLKTVDGLGMLLHQAVPGFEKWFGVRPVVTDELRDIILST